jgi:hypothetical protein
MVAFGRAELDCLQQPLDRLLERVPGPDRKAISCWPRLHSPFADSTYRPAHRQPPAVQEIGRRLNFVYNPQTIRCPGTIVPSRLLGSGQESVSGW